MFDLTFLGTSSGVPTKYRNVTALAVECIDSYLKGKGHKRQCPWILIDCGEGTQHQLLKTKLSLSQLAVICITHVHGDHCYGLPGLLASMAMSGRTEKLLLLAPKALKHLLDVLIPATQLRLSFPIEFMAVEEQMSKRPSAVEIILTPSHILTIDITPLSHRAPSYAFGLQEVVETRRLKIEKLRAMGIPAGPIWGQIQKDETIVLNSELERLIGQKTLKATDFVERIRQTTKIVIAGDNEQPELLFEAIKGASLLVHEATYTQTDWEIIKAKKLSAGQNDFNPMHTTAQAIASFAELGNLPNLILTHFSARYQPFENPNAKRANMADIRLEVERHYHGNAWLAKDFSRFRVTENGQVRRIEV